MQGIGLPLALAVVAASAALAAGLILILRPLLIRYLLAHPNARSSHQIATPQGAGVAVVAASAFGGKDGFRISFAADDAVLEEAVARIARALA